MGIYIFILILYILIFFLPSSRTRNTFFLCLFIISLSLLAAYRGNLGTDTSTYVEIYNNVNGFLDINMKEFNVEPGFLIFASICKSLNFSVQQFFFSLSFITNIIISCVSSRFTPKFIIPSLILFYCMFYLQLEFNIIRHGIMAVSVWMAFSYIQSNKIRNFLIWIFLGSTFHTLALFFLPFFWILKLDFNRIWRLLILISCIIMGKTIQIFQILGMMLIMENDVNKSINYYTNDFYHDKGDPSAKITMGLIMNIIILILTLYNPTLSDRKYLILKNSLFVGISLFFLFSAFGVFVQRIVNVFYISLIFLIPLLLYSFTKHKRYQKICKFIIIIYGIFYLYVNLCNKNQFGQYQFIPYF